MKVPFVSLKRKYDIYQKDYEEASLRVLRSGWYILGSELEEFEQQLAEYLGVKYCVGLNSGLDALVIAIRALDIGSGDEVILAGNTYIATALGITENGATPVFVEPDEFFLMDSNKIEAAITPRTKAILPTHLYGQACDMRVIKKIAREYGLYLLEDCAQSHGACFDGQQTGTFGEFGCFSFYPTKPLGALGDAGAVVTNDAVLAEKARMLRNYGSKVKYINEITGVNSRLDEVQSAFLKVSLANLEVGNATRREIAERYLTGIRNPLVMLPKTREKAGNVYHIFPILCERRDDLQLFLKERGVDVQIHYPIPPHLATCYKYLGIEKGLFQITEHLSKTVLSLPIYEGMPSEEVQIVIDAINVFG